MDPDLPPHLNSVRQRLAASLALHPTDLAPCAPSGLIEDLERHFDSPVLVPVREHRSWRERLQSLFASPAFGISAAAAFVLSFAAPSLLGPVDGFRGTIEAPANADQVQIVLVSEPAGMRQLVEGSPECETITVASVNELAKGLTIFGPKVMVDFETGRLRSIDAAGQEYFSAPIPEDTADLPMTIAKAVASLPE